MIFEHTAREAGMWRGWFRGGQSLEITWPRTSVGLKITTFDNDDDRTARKTCWVGLGVVQAFIPMWTVPSDWPPMDGPQWGIDLSREFGIVWNWGQKRRSWNWPFHTTLVAWEYEAEGGSWINMDQRPELPKGADWDRRPGAKRETYPYRYVLRCGRVQERSATIIRERWTRGRHILSHLGWPSRVRHSIDVEFNGEVGEGEGSWKGGTIGCGYDMLPGETPLATLRRMERERKFS